MSECFVCAQTLVQSTYNSTLVRQMTEPKAVSDTTTDIHAIDWEQLPLFQDIGNATRSPQRHQSTTLQVWSEFVAYIRRSYQLRIAQRTKFVQWATPIARDHKGPTDSFGETLPDQIREAQVGGGEKRGSLNARWVEALMGLPLGWVQPTANRLISSAVRPNLIAENTHLDWKSPVASEGEGGILAIWEGADARYKLRAQVAHQGNLNFWPKSKEI